MYAKIKKALNQLGKVLISYATYVTIKSYYENNLQSKALWPVMQCFTAQPGIKTKILLEICENLGIGKTYESCNFININYFINLMSDYENLLIHLNQDEKFAIIHILISIFILICVLNMIGLYLGDRLIIYFNLEVKFPKLAKIIQLRRKFLTYYFLFDGVLIILALFVIVGFNLYNVFY